MKIKSVTLIFSISAISAYAQPSVEDRGALIARTVAVATARQELPFFLRFGIKRVEPIHGTAQELQAALAYQQQQVAQAHNEHDKKAQTIILQSLQRMVVE